MKSRLLEVDVSRLPIFIKVKGEQEKHVLFQLKSAGRKLGAQLIKVDCNMLQLQGQY